MRALLAFALSSTLLRAFGGHAPVASFTENRGQWPDQVLYRTRIPGGALFVEGNALTYSLYRGGPLAGHAHDGPAPVEPMRCHAYRVWFEGAAMAQGQGSEVQPHYENYFIGNDPAHWGTHCAVYGMVRTNGLYPGIDLRIDGRNGLKYDLLVAAGADPSAIVMRFDGPDGLELRDGRLFVHTSAGDVIEEAPVAYQETATGRKGVRCRYRLRGDRVSFELPNGYDRSLPLVIDPVLSFGSYTGSTGDNFGFTATYDAAGHLYGGGIVFDVGYPITTGVLDPSFNGGAIDIGLTKFTPDGTSLVWSTYLGGGRSESPHSLVVNSNEELYVLGSSGSDDFPVTAGAFDNSFNGGVEINSGPLGDGWAGLSGGYGYGHLLGTDIIVAHLSADATSLIASTYVGGSNNDGVNNVLPLAYNYGDAFRGEIALDPQERPVVATSTASSDIPVSAGAPQPTYGGGIQDAYFFRMDPALTTLQATFYGGSGADSGYGVQFDSNGQIFLSGGTTSSDLPMAGASWHASAPGGGVDGYVARFSPNGGTMLSSTYVGTSGYDQCYFVQLNTANEVYVVGQTHGNYPVTPGKYANPGSSQFIQKLDHDLTTSLWSTVIGSGQGNEDISPCAFLVSDCGQIYFSGWGGAVNSFAQAASSTTAGLPVTADAFQSATDGSDFYLMVLDPEAVSLEYATFFGGGISMEHVDGGTSRFDKDGTVYQAVCAGCGGHDDFPTTPDAWSTVNNNSCNLGVFKFNLSRLTAEVHIDGPSEVCIPGTVQFINESTGGTNYSWTFGDGGTSHDFEPQHTYTEQGLYTVVMILTDSNGCAIGDTTNINVTGDVPDDASVDPVDTLCPGLSVQLHAHGGATYSWSPPDFLDDPTSDSPTATPPDDIHYEVTVIDACGTDSAGLVIVVEPVHGQASPDTVICLGDTVALMAYGGTQFAWSPGATLSATDVADPLAFPGSTTDYIVHISVQQGCEATDTVTVSVEETGPVPVTDDVSVCRGDSVQLNASGGDGYLWVEPTTDAGTPDPTVAPMVTQWYHVHVINACADVLDSVLVDVQYVDAVAWPDTTVCPGAPVLLHASGGTSYAWSPAASLESATAADVMATPTDPTDYRVIVSNALGCADTAMARVHLFPAPYVHASGDVTIDFGDSVRISAFGQGVMHWDPDASLDCDSCSAPMAAPLTTTTYIVSLIDTNGCRTQDDVIVYVNGSLFVPNTFTPNGDGINDGFRALATEVKDFRLYVFNRWGERIYEADALDKPWDGTYQGVESPIDTYVWRVDLTELSGHKRTVFGHVNLLR